MVRSPVSDGLPYQNIPVPDPSLLTTEQLRRELGAMRDILDVKIGAVENATAASFKELDSSLERLHGAIKDWPGMTSEKIGHLRALHEERFNSVQKQFDERDVRAKAAEDAAKVAVNAALQAQKEAAGAQNDSNAAAITKSEAATIKQIDGILALLASNTKAIDDKISVINGRLDRGEASGKQVVRQEDVGLNQSNTRAVSQANLIAVVALIATVLVGLYAVSSNHSMGVGTTPVSVNALPQVK